MSKLTVDFINWVHVKCFNVFFCCCFFFYQFDGFADVIIKGHLKGEKMLYLEVKAT